MNVRRPYQYVHAACRNAAAHASRSVAIDRVKTDHPTAKMPASLSIHRQERA